MRKIYLNHLIVQVDFKKAVIEVLKNTIGNDVCIKWCFITSPETRVEIQSPGLENMNRNKNNFCILCRNNPIV